MKIIDVPRFVMGCINIMLAALSLVLTQRGKKSPIAKVTG